jgi:hypothetical protein
LQGSGSFHPELVADRPGPYRVRLIVTDESGTESLEREVVVIAGDRCGDGVDNDVDGRIDTDDPDCDGEDQPEVEPPDHAVADAPLDVVAAGGPRQVAVDWSPPADDGGTPITAYRVVDEAGTVVVTTAAEVTQAAIVGVPAGPSPRYRVVAVNAEGDSLPSPLTTVVSVDSAPVVFPDVGEGHPFFAEITWGVVAGLLRGRSDGTFAPASPVDRASWAAFLHRLAGSPSGPFADPGFADVGAGHPFFAEIAWAGSAGVMHGYGDATFRPSTTVDRAASVAVLHRLAGSPSGPFADPGFADVGAGHPFFAEIAWAVSTGVMHGYGDGLFRPASALSRQASVAAMLRSTREFDALG